MSIQHTSCMLNVKLLYVSLAISSKIKILIQTKTLRIEKVFKDGKRISSNQGAERASYMYTKSATWINFITSTLCLEDEKSIPFVKVIQC